MKNNVDYKLLLKKKIKDQKYKKHEKKLDSQKKRR